MNSLIFLLGDSATVNGLNLIEEKTQNPFHFGDTLNGLDVRAAHTFSVLVLEL